MSIKCKVCNQIIETDDMFCPYCGNKVDRHTDRRVCPSCGMANEKDENFCVSCGKKLNDSGMQPVNTAAVTPTVSQLGTWICNECGAQNNTATVFCLSCGAKSANPDDQTHNAPPKESVPNTVEPIFSDTGKIPYTVSSDKEDIKSIPSKSSSNSSDEEKKRLGAILLGLLAVLLVVAIVVMMPLWSRNESNKPSSGKNQAAQHTLAPKSTRTPKPTNTPKSTVTQKPTNTPKPTSTPKPIILNSTNTPKPTGTPKPTKTPKPTSTPKPTKTPKPTRTPTPKPTAIPAPSYYVGDIIYMGSYQQGNGSSPVAWKILSISGNQALLVSEKLLDHQQFFTPRKKVSWADSEIRQWLNYSFYNSCFSSQEKNAILSATLNTNYGGRNVTTTDKVFLLSTQEVKNYFSSASRRRAYATSYALRQGVVDGYWLLRDSDQGGQKINVIYPDGSIYTNQNTEAEGYGVRPAMYVNLSRLP